MRTLEKSEDDLLTKYQVTKASLSDHLDKLKKYSQGCEKQALNNAAKSKILCPRNGLSRIYPNERWNMELNHNLIRLRLTRNTSSHYVNKLNQFLRMVYTQRHVNEMKWNACTSYRFNWECGQTKVMLKGHKKLLGFGMQSPTSIWLSKTIIARDVVLVYPNYSTKFEIYMLTPPNPNLAQSLLKTDY